MDAHDAPDTVSSDSWPGDLELRFNDPLLDDELPYEVLASFVRLERTEQSWRGRLYLMTWALGASEPYAWFVALGPDPDRSTETFVRSVPDERIREAVELQREMQ